MIKTIPKKKKFKKAKWLSEGLQIAEEKKRSEWQRPELEKSRNVSTGCDVIKLDWPPNYTLWAHTHTHGHTHI